MRSIEDNHTGYVAKTRDGSAFVEPTGSGTTGWNDLPMHLIKDLEFWWNGRLKATMSVSAIPAGSTPYYCHTASIDSRDFSRSTLLSRSFGYQTSEGKKVVTVFEEDSGNARSCIGF